MWRWANRLIGGSDLGLEVVDKDEIGSYRWDRLQPCAIPVFELQRDRRTGTRGEPSVPKEVARDQEERFRLRVRKVHGHLWSVREDRWHSPPAAHYFHRLSITGNQDSGLRGLFHR